MSDFAVSVYFYLYFSEGEGHVSSDEEDLADDADATDARKRARQVWSLTQLYSVDFSQSRIGGNKCVFNKRTIKIRVSCC